MTTASVLGARAAVAGVWGHHLATARTDPEHRIHVTTIPGNKVEIAVGEGPPVVLSESQARQLIAWVREPASDGRAGAWREWKDPDGAELHVRWPRARAYPTARTSARGRPGFPADLPDPAAFAAAIEVRLHPTRRDTT